MCEIVTPIMLCLHLADFDDGPMFLNGHQNIRVDTHCQCDSWINNGIYSCSGTPGWAGWFIECVDTFVFWTLISNNFLSPTVLGWLPSVL